jgi:hypothetical protein
LKFVSFSFPFVLFFAFLSAKVQCRISGAYIQRLEDNFGIKISRPSVENFATARTDFLTPKNFAFGQIIQSTANTGMVQTIVAEFEAYFFAANGFILEELKMQHRVQQRRC